MIESRHVDPVEALQVGQSFGQPRHVLPGKQKEIITHAHTTLTTDVVPFPPKKLKATRRRCILSQSLAQLVFFSVLNAFAISFLPKKEKKKETDRKWENMIAVENKGGTSVF